MAFIVSQVDFECAIKKAILDTNLSLCGVAKIYNGHTFVWSASLAVGESGKFPAPSPANYPVARGLFQKMLLIGYTFKDLYSVEFTMQPDLSGVRWQATYSVITD